MRYDQLWRKEPTVAEKEILNRGLSPWSYGNKCDLCACERRYMLRHGLEQAPIYQRGRWMLHKACEVVAIRDRLLVVNLPALSYLPYSGLPPIVKIDLMKIRLAEESWSVIEECAI